MKIDNLIIPNYLFEVSWEVCNKVGGIHTVIASKTPTLAKILKGKHIMIGPDVAGENNPEFEEDHTLLQNWKNKASSLGLSIRIGRWKIKEKPIAVLVNFSNLFSHKDLIFKHFWDKYKLDSLTGEWDYIEPAIFGYAVGKVIECYVDTYCSPEDKIVAQFHEWMTGTGLLYLKDKSPQVACAFTTHATALGRSIAGNHLPLYDNLTNYDPDEMASRFNIRAKQSLEKQSAVYADTFTTVSDITARECAQFHSREVDKVTPNGFQDFIGKDKLFEKKCKVGRDNLVNVAESILGYQLSKDALLVGTSGRYEFKNKGIDVFIDALGKLNEDKKLKREIVAFILVPAGHNGPVQEVLHNMENPKDLRPVANPYLSHYLTDEYHDPSLNAIRNNQLFNTKDDKVKIFFVPSYLNGDDGVFNKPYYDILAGLDLSVFPSYYEPWGYTPLESVAFKVPTITTTLAGFGLWVKDLNKKKNTGITVIERNDHNDQEVSEAITLEILRHVSYNATQKEKAREDAYEVSKIALWDNLAIHYLEAYSDALKKIKKEYKPKPEQIERVTNLNNMNANKMPNWHNIIVHRNVPDHFSGLEAIAHNLWWSWTQDAIDVFQAIDPEAWEECNHNPIELLDKVSVAGYKELIKDKSFVAKVEKLQNKFDAYMKEKENMKGNKIAYFCMEFGLHTSLKIYSGGLGVLAGDHMKEASDKKVRMAGVGFLYRYGYFTQRISASGDQENIYESQLFDKLPVSPAKDKDGNWVEVELEFPGRTLYARVWRADVGRTELYLLDTDYEKNSPHDRSITYQLYGGDWENRLAQELLLGIGGARALDKLGIVADVYHCNEGHAAFVSIERIHRLMRDRGLTFDEAREVVRSSSLFTTHTPVPAGHDAFDEGLLHKYLSFYPERLNISWDQFIGFGRVNPNDHNEKFSMSNLAIRMTQEVNGVSWLHGKVSQKMFANLFPGYLDEEIPIGHVTNGVHYPTWAAPEWKNLMEEVNGGEMSDLNYDRKCFSSIQKVEDEKIWDIRNKLRKDLIDHIKMRVSKNMDLMYYTPREIVSIVENLNPETLTIGFARRFATYKRADLLFRNLDTLERIINNPDRPVQFIFAGKSHPADGGGKALIKRIVEVSKYPQFLGKIIFIENYDMTLASKMIQGVDIWLNTPTRPMEASGTSGCKAVMNGVMHFSVLDGWWVEGYKEGAGWMLPLEQVYENNEFQNELDAETIYHTIENIIAPKYYDRKANKPPKEWIKIVKNTVDEVASNFTMNRFLQDYEDRYYNKLAKRHKDIMKNKYAMAKDIVTWKRHVANEWNSIDVINRSSFDMSLDKVQLGKEYKIEISLTCGNLDPKDIGVQLMLVKTKMEGRKQVEELNIKEFKLKSKEGSVATYELKFMADTPGTFSTGVRIYAQNELLANQTESGFVRWL